GENRGTTGRTCPLGRGIGGRDAAPVASRAPTGLLVATRQILANCAGSLLTVQLAARELGAGKAAYSARIGLHHAGIHRKAFTADQAFPDAPLHHRLEYKAEGIALAKAPMAVFLGTREPRHYFFKAQPTEPPVSQIEMNLFAQPTLRANAKTVAHQQHPDHELRIYRRASSVAVERLELPPQLAEIEEVVNPAQQVIRWNVLVEV